MPLEAIKTKKNRRKFICGRLYVFIRLGGRDIFTPQLFSFYIWTQKAAAHLMHISALGLTSLTASWPRPCPGTQESHSQPTGAHPGCWAWLSVSLGHRCPEEVVTWGLVRATRWPCDLRVARDHSCPRRRSQNNGQLLPVPVELKIDIQTVKCKILSCAQTV